MNIAELLAKGQSRSSTEAIVAFVGCDPGRFAELYRVFERGGFRLQQCAAWPISVIAEDHPELVEPYLRKLIEYLLRNDVHDAVKRSVARLLQYVDVPKGLYAKVFSLCIELVADPSGSVAARCFAMTAAAKIARTDGSLMSELKLVAASQADHATAGLKVRIRRILSEK